MRVRFYDAGQALAALVTLPDGRRLLVDAGESPRRPCAECKAWHERVMAGLRRDVGPRGLDLVWITHQHSDHVGGAKAVLGAFFVGVYVDNGRDLEKRAGVRNARVAVAASSTKLRVVAPEHHGAPLTGGVGVTLTPIVPAAWSAECTRAEESAPNACSIALRIDYCKSSVLLTGAAPKEEEELFDTRAEVTLLLVGHHGSKTSTSEAFLAKARPKYAVISAARPGEGTNDRYCHPRSVVVENLTKAMGGAGGARHERSTAP